MSYVLEIVKTKKVEMSNLINDMLLCLFAEFGGLCKTIAAQSNPDLPADTLLALSTAVPARGRSKVPLVVWSNGLYRDTIHMLVFVE